MLKKRTKLKTPRRQISRSRANRSLLNRQRSFFLQNEYLIEHNAQRPLLG